MKKNEAVQMSWDPVVTQSLIVSFCMIFTSIYIVYIYQYIYSVYLHATDKKSLTGLVFLIPIQVTCLSGHVSKVKQAVLERF